MKKLLFLLPLIFLVGCGTGEDVSSSEADQLQKKISRLETTISDNKKAQDDINEKLEDSDVKLANDFEAFANINGFVYFTEPEKEEVGYFTKDPRKKEWQELGCGEDSYHWVMREEEYPGEFETWNKKCSALAKKLNLEFISL